MHAHEDNFGAAEYGNIYKEFGTEGEAVCNGKVPVRSSVPLWHC